ncbi:hypothetical protein NIES970_19520 [[Synechococcus] sp. NIES-970]|uniref:hypothetical protein n=1 Tax=Picosynechococcus sp. NKBG15041c TaxID=1407650 RepID=UPI0004267D90|nr:hypothetical protein [Picosynechococcus sp. NKBG15041c]BAW97008.1 hypothetical protein NIES970_19520 [[Synechococcus] sp. NIES-970]
MSTDSTDKSPKIYRLGELLENAGLISEAQLQTALFDQQIYSDLKFGEILALRGWVSQHTADFFVKYNRQELIILENKRLGDYLIDADLLTPEQLVMILDEQKVNHMMFGSLAVLKGYIKQQTLNFFLKNILSQVNGDRQFWRTTQSSKVSLVDRPLDAKLTQPSEMDITSAKQTDPSEIHWIN